MGATGIRASATEGNGRILNWTYDGIYRLTNEAIVSDPAGANGAVGYGLDPVGNRLSSSSTLSGVSSGSYSNNINDLLSIETYDANGNTLITGGKSFAYDSENRLKSMNGGAVTLLYDGDDNRVTKTMNGVTTRYLVDDLNPTGYAQVVEEVGNGAVQREYTYGLQRISQNQIINGTWTPSFYGYDGGGTVRQLTNTVVRSPIPTATTPTAICSIQRGQHRTTISIAANNMTPTSASTTSAPDTTTRSRDAS